MTKNVNYSGLGINRESFPVPVLRPFPLPFRTFSRGITFADRSNQLMAAYQREGKEGLKRRSLGVRTK